MGSEEDLTLRMRTKGTGPAKRDVDSLGKSVTGLGGSTKEANRHAGLLGRTTRGLLSPFRHLKGEAVGLAKSFVGIGLAFGSVEGIKRSIETTDEFVKTTVQLRNQFGLTTEAASGLAGVMAARNLAPQGLRMGLISLSKQMQAVANGNDQAAEAFHYVGITADDVRAGLASPDGLMHIFERVTGALTEMPGGANKAAYGQMLLGRATKSLAPLLQEGALGLEQQLKWAKEYGVTLDGKTVGSVEDMAAAQTQAQYAALGLQISLGRLLSPTVKDVNVFFADVVRSFRDGRPEGGKFSRTIYQIGQDLKPVGEELKDVAGYLKDHPKLLQAAAVGFIAYKTKLLSLLFMAPKAYLQGLLTGRAFARGVATGAAEGEGAAAVAGAGRLGGGIFAKAFLPVAAGVIGFELIDYLRKDPGHWMEHVHNALKDAVNFVSPHTIAPTPKRSQIDKAVAGALPGTRQYDLEQILKPHGGTGPASATARGDHRLYGADEALRVIASRFTHGELVQFLQPRAGLHTPSVERQLAIVEAAMLKRGHLIVENHNTITLDGKVVAKGVHRAAVRAKAVK